jgi:hypothetical protein
MSHNPFITGARIGAEGEPVIVIDGFHPEPESLILTASMAVYGDPGRFYPGVRAPAEPGHLQACQGVLAEVLRRGFGLSGARLAETSYSLVTTRPEDLAPIQRLPHFDGTDPNRIALLHYLTGPEAAGTAFYRQRETGFETVTADRLEVFKAALHRGYPEGPPQRYFAGGDHHFEQIHTVEARFNRAVIYRGVTLHSGLIPEDFGFTANPADGRLTINTFLEG